MDCRLLCALVLFLSLLAHDQAAAANAAALEVAHLPAAATAGEQGQLANEAAGEDYKSGFDDAPQPPPSAVLRRSHPRLATADAQPSAWWHSCVVLLRQHAAGLLHWSAQQHKIQQEPSKLGGQRFARQAAARKLMAQQVAHIQAYGTQPGFVLGSVSAAPFLVLVLLMLMVSGRFGWLSQRSSKPDSGPAHSILPADPSCEGDAVPADAAVHLADGDAACKSDAPTASSTEKPAQLGRRQLLAGSVGWELSPSLTAPVLGHIGGHEVRFGKLLGTGSISRVWQSNWCNTSVAVKVLHCNNPTSLTLYEQQLQQLVSLEHPQVVRTHCGVIIHAGQGGSGSGSGLSSGLVSTSGSQQELQCIHVPHSAQQQQALQNSTKPRAHPNNSISTRGLHIRDDVTAAAAPPAAADVSPCAEVSTASAAAIASSSSSSSGACGAFSLRTGLLHQQLQQQKEGRVAAAAADKDSQPEAEVWMVQELCDLGSLRSVALEWQIAGEGDPQMHERLNLLLGAARGLKYLHSKGIVHGDLSADNILVCSSSDSPVGMTAKVSDMGLCAAVKHTNCSIASSVRALSHVAPEVQRGGRAEPHSDVFAFGILMWEVFTGQQAYRKLLDAEHLYEAVVVQNLRPKIPEGMPRDYQLLLERCWASDPADRPSLNKLLGCLSVMAAERARRINPHAHHPPPATPAAAVAVAAAHTRRMSALAHTHSCDQATLRAFMQQQQAAQQVQLVGSVPGSIPGQGSFFGSGPPVWRLGSDSSSGSSRTLPVVGSSSTPVGSGLVLGPGTVPGRQQSQAALTGSHSLVQQKSCPASAFESLLRSRGAVLGRSLDSDLSETPDQMQREEEAGFPSAADGVTGVTAAAAGSVTTAAGESVTAAAVKGVTSVTAAEAEAAFEDELQEEEAMLLQLRVSSLTQSGPGSAPVLHSQPHQRHMDGLNMWPPPELDDSYMWHI